MNERLKRSAMLLGGDKIDTLEKSCVAVVGLGGVGSWCAEALARSGVGKLILLDEDVVALSNINRQACALNSTVGKSKAEVVAARVRDISSDIEIICLHARYEACEREILFSHKIDYIADCIDVVTCKLDLIETAIERNIPIISALGTGNKLDATKLKVADISKTSGCSFARVIRKELRERGILHHKVVYSEELAIKTTTDEVPPKGRRSVPGSVIWVPASAGLLMAQEIVLEM